MTPALLTPTAGSRGRRLDRCFLVPRRPPVFCVLGRFGDLILLLPAFLELKRRTGLKPIVYVSRHYASVLEGVSYATPEIVNEDWYDGMPAARRMAQAKYGGAIVPAWWADPDTATDILLDIRDAGVRILQSHGRQWGVDCSANPDFGTSMWRRAGFTRQEMLTLPLVFDRRSGAREELLYRTHVHDAAKPLLLYNFTGCSSPFGYTPELMRLLQPYRSRFFMLDLGVLKAARIYDLLGLYDRAAGLLTIDTATAHLAPASRVPAIWFTVCNWGKSVPRGNCALHVPYDETPRRLTEVSATLERWLA